MAASLPLSLKRPSPPALKPLKTVMSDVISGWENQAIETGLTAMANDLLAKINEGQQMASLGYEANVEVDILRDASIESTPYSMIDTPVWVGQRRCSNH